MTCGMEDVVVEAADDKGEKIENCGNLIKLEVYWLTWRSVCKSSWCLVCSLG